MSSLHRGGGIMQLRLLTFLFIFGYINAVPFYGDNFEFVPLESQSEYHQHQQARNDAFDDEKPFDIDVVTSEVGGGGGSSGGAAQNPGLFFQQSFPFFGHDFFNSFGGFGIGAGPQEVPWYKGANVCTEKSEDENVEDVNKENAGGAASGAPAEGQGTDNVEVTPPIFGQFHFSVNSCVERPNKYVCTRTINKNGKKKTLTITRQCCHGYGRPRNADFVTPCEKIEVKNIDETAAAMGAKEFVATAKSNSGLAGVFAKKNVTVFMPIDSAFVGLNDQAQSETNLVEAKAGEAMRHLYQRHIVDGEISLYDTLNDQILNTQEPGQTIRLNAYQMPPGLGPEPFRYTANCVPVEKHDKMSEQGMVHTIGGVLKPITKSIMDIIRERADLSIMRTVLDKTKMSELLEGKKPVTIFVPTDAAFEKLEPHLRRALKEGKRCAANILKNHMLDLTFCSVASVAGAKTTAYNLLSEPMRFNRSRATNDKSEVSDLVDEPPVMINGIANIIEADIMGTNGVLHVVDTILPTQSALPLSTLLKEKNVTLFMRLLEAAGLDETYDDMENVTVFAPTDKALQGTKWVQLLNNSPEQLANNAELLEFLNYHVATPMTKTCDLSEQLMPTVTGANVRVNLYSTNSLLSNVMNRATVNCARLVHFDDESCGSVLHQVDKVLTAPKMNLLQMLESNPNYSRFLELVRSANLTGLLTNIEEGYTLLVPKNEVFEEVEDWERTLTKDQGELENLIKTHVVNDVVCCAGIIPTNWPFVRSIESLNGAHLRITRDRRPKIENAGVTKCDGVATNGIIHEINDIIVPPARRNHNRPPQQHPFDHHGENFGGFFI